jgi:hypothetical protein
LNVATHIAEAINLAPMFFFWALGRTLMLGLLDETKSAEHFAQSAQCPVTC